MNETSAPSGSMNVPCISKVVVAIADDLRHVTFVKRGSSADLDKAAQATSSKEREQKGEHHISSNFTSVIDK